MEGPLVSVLLASYNHEKYVEAAVRSIMDQKGVDFELLVIDDGSTDSSPEILERLSKELAFKYRHRPNKGLVPTLNELLAEARGKYFCTFASDDIMAPGRLCAQSDFLENHPEKVACFGQCILMNENGTLDERMEERYLRAMPRISFEECFLGKKVLQGCAEMYSREAVESLGNYDEKYSFEDYPMNLKILRRFGPQPVRNVLCCYYREHSYNMHRDCSRLYREILRMFSEDYRAEPLYRKACRAWKAYWFSTLASQDKVEALKKFSETASLSWIFLSRLLKLFVPRRFLGK